MSRSFSANAGSLDSLKVLMRWGWRPCARQIRCTERRLIPAAAAMARPVHCGASPGNLRTHGQDLVGPAPNRIDQRECRLLSRHGFRSLDVVRWEKGAT